MAGVTSDPLRLMAIWSQMATYEENDPQPFNTTATYSTATDAFIMSWYDHGVWVDREREMFNMIYLYVSVL